jgi:acyl-coenzyme A thioesterase PaaI-like protein
MGFRELSSERAEHARGPMYKPLSFEPNQWPGEDNAEGSNCYSYALDQKDYHWAIPGHEFFSGIAYEEYAHKFNAYFTPFKFRTKEFQRAIVDGAIRDGLEWVRDDPIERDGYSLLALFFPTKEEHYNDFHWYRKDDGGRRSQKRGVYQAQEIDDAGDPIDKVTIELPFDERFSGPKTLFPASIVGTAGDVAAVSSCLSLLPKGWALATLDFTVKMTGVAKGEKLKAKGRVLQAGHTNSVGAADIYRSCRQRRLVWNCTCHHPQF